MIESESTHPNAADGIECFGEFNPERLVCKKLCALNIRCAIEKDKNVRMEILEELVSEEATILKTQ